MQSTKTRYSTFILAVLMGSSTSLIAATQGTPGPTSTGTVTINASITPEVNITDLDDITFDATALATALSTGADAVKGDDVCVWSNLPSRGYYITASGDGAASAFILNDGARTLDYSVFWTDTANTPLTANTKSAQFTSTATQPDCGGATTASVTVTISNSEIAAMDSTTNYSGVLTLLVTPN